MRGWHEHNYEMTFEDDTLNYKLVCRCGDSTDSLEEAMRRTRRSVMEPIWWVVGFGGFLMVFVGVYYIINR